MTDFMTLLARLIGTAIGVLIVAMVIEAVLRWRKLPGGKRRVIWIWVGCLVFLLLGKLFDI